MNPNQDIPSILANLLNHFGLLGPLEEVTEQEVISAGIKFLHDLQYQQLVTSESISKWGEKAQANQATEECAELIVALNKYYNRDYNGNTKVDVVTEVADVEIMMSCMRQVLGDSDVSIEKMHKIERLATTQLGLPSREAFVYTAPPILEFVY